MSTTTQSSTLFFFFFNDTATTEIYTLSLHDALPIYWAARARTARAPCRHPRGPRKPARTADRAPAPDRDRKSTRLNSSHDQISYAVFCLKQKNDVHVHTLPHACHF